MLRVWSVSGVCRVMKSARASSSSSSTFSTPSSTARSGGQEGIVGDHLHPQAERAVGDDRADIAAADQAERLAGQLDAHEAVLLPLAGLGGGVGGGQLAGEREHQGDGMLGGGDRVAERRVHDDDAARGGGRDVDIVDADAGAADHLEVGGGLEHVRGDLGRRADGEAVIVADDRLQLVLGQAGLLVDLDAAARKISAALGSIWSEMSTLGIRILSPSSRRRPGSAVGRTLADSSLGPGLRRDDESELGALRAKAQSSQGPSASISAVSTVAPHQMRRPGGASR